MQKYTLGVSIQTDPLLYRGAWVPPAPWQAAADGSNTWVHATHMGEKRGIPVSYIWPGPAQAKWFTK